MAVQQQIFYRDLSLDPSVDSQGDIGTVTNKEAIKQSLYMLINTNKGTRIFQPNYGCRIKGFLFEPFDSSVATQIGKELEETIKNYEPRVQLIKISVDMDDRTTSYNISVVYRINNTEEADFVKVTLEKI